MPTPTVEQVAEAVVALEHRVARLEGMTEVVSAIRADVATIAEGVDPSLAGHVAELDDRVDKHALLIGRLLEATPLARRREGDDPRGGA